LAPYAENLIEETIEVEKAGEIDFEQSVAEFVVVPVARSFVVDVEFGVEE